MKFKSDIEVQAGLRDSSGAIGSSGQILSSTGTNVSWINQSTVASDVQNQVKAGVAITKGQAVYVTGADGTNIIVGLASNASEATSSKTLGLLDATVAINGFANVVQIGRLSGLNTLGATAGDPVWLGTGGNLIYGLIGKPYAPANLVFIGIVTRVNVNNGEIFVSVQNGFELNEIHDVDLKTTVPVNGDILGFDGTLWVNKTIAGWLGYTPANASGTVNYVSKFTGTTTLGNSQIFDNGTNVGIGMTSPSSKLNVNGIIKIEGDNALYMGGGASVIPTWGIIPSGNNLEITGVATNTNGNVSFLNFGNVGIGTSSISAKLHVSGNTLVTGTLEVDTVNNGVGDFLTRTAGGIVTRRTATEVRSDIGAQAALTNPVTGTGTLNFISKFTSTGSTLGNSQLFDNGTNVGIGTSSPSVKLDVLSNIANSAIVQFSGAVQGRGFRISTFNNGTSDGGVLLNAQTTTNAVLAFATNSSERMRIDNLGNVGIGVTTMSQRLEVLGRMVLDNGQESSYIGTSSGIADPATTLTRNVGIGARTFQNNITGIRNVAVGVSASLSNLGNDNVAIGFETLRLNTVASNTGVGYQTLTTATTAVENTAIGKFALREITTGGTNTAAGFGAGRFTNAGGNNTLGTASVFLGHNTRALNNSDTNTIVIGAGALGIGPNSVVLGNDSIVTTALKGDVGIGTTTPGAKLDVNGSMRLVDISTGISTITFPNGTQIEANGPGGYFKSGLVHSSLSGPSAGNVGIGTTSPSFKLDVVGNGRFSSNLLTTGRFGVGYINNFFASTVSAISGDTGTAVFSTFDNSVSVQEAARFSTADLFAGAVRIHPRVGTAFFNGITVADSATIINFPTKPLLVGVQDGSAIQFTETDIRIGTNNFEKVRITSSGSVGIGTTIPQSKLHIIGDGITLATADTTFGFGSIKTVVPDTINYPYEGDMVFSSFRFSGSYNIVENLRIVARTGNVGIGTASPSQLLHVAGNARITGAVYDSSNSAGSSGQVLSSTGSGTAWVTGGGGGGISGSGTTNYVPKFTSSTAIGNSNISDSGSLVTVSTDAVINNKTVGLGGGNIDTNSAFGKNALVNNTSGYDNVAIGDYALEANTQGFGNLALGSNAGSGITLGNRNNIIGANLFRRPDNGTFDGSYTLAIGKSNSVSNLPQIWSPEALICPDSVNTTILEIDPASYSGVVLDYCLDDVNNSLSRIGTFKMTYKTNGGSIAFLNDSEIESGGSTGGWVLKAGFNSGTGCVFVYVQNTNGSDVIVHYTARLLLREGT